MQRVAELHDKKRMSKGWIERWDWGMDTACERGDLPMVKWMAEHRTGRAVLARENDSMVFTFSKIIENAAKGGYIEILQCLFENGWTDEDAVVLNSAAGGGHLDCVQWLLDNAPVYGTDNSAHSAIVSAAKNGHLEMLKSFHQLDSSAGVPNETGSKRRKTEQTIEWWSWSAEALEAAASKGHLEVVKWIHANHYNGCRKHAMDEPARNGHMEVLKWLQLNTTAGCTTYAMDGAAFRGHLHECKWLYANRSEGCTADAVKYAVGNGHLRVVRWLCKQYPQYVPEHNRLWKYPSNTFDMLLFLEVHYSTLFTLEFGRGTKSDLQYENKRGSDFLIAQWLDQKYLGRPTEKHQLVMWPMML